MFSTVGKAVLQQRTKGLMGKTKGSAVWDWGPAERCQVKAVYFKQQAGKGDPLAMF